VVPIHRHLGQFQALADSSGGQVRLLIDGVSQGVFDLSSATPQPRSFSFGNLTSGAHVLQVASYRGRATLDTFSAPGSVPFFTPPTRSGIVRYEEDDPALRYNGVPFASSVTSWAMGSMSRLSRGYGAWSKLANNSASLSFTGSWVSLGFASQTNAGKAELFIDGSSRGVIDTYSSTNDVVSATYSNLTAGSHTLSLTVLGQRNTNASDNYVHLDYIDVWDGTAMSQGTVEQDDARVWPSSGWQSSSEATASGSTYISGGTNLWLPFTGDSVTYQARTCNGCGSVEVLLDGQSHGAFSLNSSTTATRAWTFAGLGAGPHLLRVKAAQGAATVDAFEAPGRTPGSAPANLRAAGTTQTSITLVWDAATAQSDVTGYDVYTGGFRDGHKRDAHESDCWDGLFAIGEGQGRGQQCFARKHTAYGDHQQRANQHNPGCANHAQCRLHSGSCPQPAGRGARSERESGSGLSWGCRFHAHRADDWIAPGERRGLHLHCCGCGTARLFEHRVYPGRQPIDCSRRPRERGDRRYVELDHGAGADAFGHCQPEHGGGWRTGGAGACRSA